MEVIKLRLKKMKVSLKQIIPKVLKKKRDHIGHNLLVGLVVLQLKTVLHQVLLKIATVHPIQTPLILQMPLILPYFCKFKTRFSAFELLINDS